MNFVRSKKFNIVANDENMTMHCSGTLTSVLLAGE